MRSSYAQELPHYLSFNEAAADDELFESIFAKPLGDNLPDLPSDDIFLVSHKMLRPTPFHTHDYCELAYVLKGKLINRVGDDTLHLLEGSMCVMREGTQHALEVSDPNAIVTNICLRKGLFESGVFRDFVMAEGDLARFMSGRDNREYMVYADVFGQSLRSSVIALLREYDQAKQQPTFGVAARVLLLLERLRTSKDYSFYGIDRRTMEIIDLIEQSCTTATVSSLARELGYNESYFSQLIRSKTGLTPLALITNARLRKAYELLETTNLSVTDVSSKVGYQSYSHFNKLFTKTFGITPARARTLSREVG